MENAKSNLKVTASDALEFEPVAAKMRKGGGFLKTLLILVLAGGGGAATWAFYGDKIKGLFHDPESEIPVVRADSSPVKVRPENPGGLQVPNRDKLVYSRMQGGGTQEGSVERLLPPPETPLPRPGSDVGTGPGGRTITVTPETPLETASDAPSASVRDVAPIEPPPRVDRIPKVTDVAKAERPAPAPPPPPAVPSKPVTQQSLAQPQGLTPAPAPTSRTTPAPAAATPAPAAPQVARRTAPAVGSTSYRVQLAAARTAEAARGEWDRLRRKSLDLLGDLGLTVTKVDLGAAKGIFYRLQVGPLAGEKEARALCKALAARKLACLIVRPGK